MNIIIGKGGNQLMPLYGENEAPLYCYIEDLQDGTYCVTLLNHRPTFVDGEILSSETTVDGSSVIKAGQNFEMTIDEAQNQVFDMFSLTDWGLAADRLGDSISALAFRETTLWINVEDDEEYVEDVFGKYDITINAAIAAQAYYLIKEGCLHKAQELLYEAGDDLYENQDGSAIRKGAYAGVLGLLAELYVTAGRKDVARQALDGANQLLSQGAECSPRVREQIKKCATLI